MCTRARNGLLRLNRTGRLQTEPMQKPGVSERVGVAAERLPESAWWLDSSGAVFAGAKAVSAAVSTALGTQLPMRIYRMPGVGSVEEATQALLEEVRENDMVITLGAGNVYRAGEMLVELLQERGGDSETSEATAQ